MQEFFFSRIFLLFCFPLTSILVSFPFSIANCHAVDSILSKTMEIETSAKPQVFEVKSSKISLLIRALGLMFLAEASCFISKNVMFLSPKTATEYK
jgi:hypothetical protein